MKSSPPAYLVLLLLHCVSADILFTILPQPRAVLLGTDLTLDCVAVSLPDSRPLTYIWEFKGRPTYDSLTKASVFVNNSLYVPRVDQTDLGKYGCIVQVTGEPGTFAKSQEITIVKAYIETFFINPSNISVTEGNNGSLECVTGSSAPPPLLQWQRDGVTFTGGTQAFATFGAIKDGGAAQKSSRLEFIASDAVSGNFQCVAENPLNHEIIRSRPATVTVIKVNKPPHLMVEPTDSMAATSQPFQLNCSASGWPAPRITWYRDDQLVTENTRRYVAPDGSLHFNQFLVSDEGSYVCTATNELGSTESQSAYVTAAYINVTFRAVPSSDVVLAGTPVTLTCQPPASVPPAKVIWYKDTALVEERMTGFLLHIAPNGDLVFASIQLDDAGRYYCIAVNDHAVPTTRTSPVANLEVRGKPILLEPPIAQKIVKGSLLTLVCKVSGRPAPTIIWFRDQTELSEDPRISFRDLGQVLLISDINKADEGDYKCMATSDLGTADSVPVFIDVIVPPEMLQSVKDVTAVEGTTAILQCQAYGEPTPQVAWFKDGQRITLGSHYSQVAKGLQINMVAASDEGVYRCVAYNEAGNKTSQATLTIAVGASIVFWPGDRSVTEGDMVTLYCDVRGTPQPTVFWTYNGLQQFPEGVTFQRNGQTLYISESNSNQTGNYSCTASNVVYTDRKTLYLLVRVKPTIEKIEGDTVINQGDELDLNCKVKGIPQPTVEWYYNGGLIRQDADHRIEFPMPYALRVKFTRARDTGEYRCLGQNAVGTTVKSVNVYIRETPIPPVLMEVWPVSTSSINISWIPVQQEPNNFATYFVVQYKLLSALDFTIYRDDIPTSTWSVEVEDLRAYTEYVFRVAARNAVGIGAFSRNLGARTLETAPSEPRGLQIVDSNATAVSLLWEIPAYPNGEVRAYQLHYRKMFENAEYSAVRINSPSLPLQEFILTGLQPFTTYEIRVRAATIENDVEHWGDFSYTVEVTTSGAVPSEPPGNVYVEVLSSTALRVSWEVPERATNAPLLGYRVFYKLANIGATSRASSSQQVISVGRDVTQTNVTNLMPYTQYSITVAAYNNVGNGVASVPQIVRTGPAKPSGSPRDVQAVALNSTALSIAWKRVRAEEENSQINGYMVQYTNRRSGAMNSVYVGNPDKLALTVGQLQPYTEYAVQVQAFTTQIQDGFGPLSSPVFVSTAQGVPGHVQNLTATAMPYSVHLKWEEPLQPNGVILTYIVTVSLFQESVTQRTVDNDLSDEKNDHLPKVKRQASGLTEVHTPYRNITIEGLQPASLYVFTVAAETVGGRDPSPASISIATVAGSSSSTMTVAIITTSVTLASSIMSSTTNATATAAPRSLTQENLALIVGLAVGGGMLLILVCIILIFCCCRLRNDASKTVYFVPPPAFTRDSVAALELRGQPPSQTSWSMYNSEDDPSPDYDSGQYSGSNASDHAAMQIANQKHKPVQLRDKQHGAVNGFATGAAKIGNIPHNMTQASDSEVHLANVPISVIGTRFSSSRSLGIINPGYYDEGAAALPDYSIFHRTQPYRHSSDLNTDTSLNKRRMNRMKSSSAAAIAAQRHAESSVFNDNNLLIGHADSVVVYDERTAL